MHNCYSIIYFLWASDGRKLLLTQTYSKLYIIFSFSSVFFFFQSYFGTVLADQDDQQIMSYHAFSTECHSVLSRTHSLLKSQRLQASFSSHRLITSCDPIYKYGSELMKSCWQCCQAGVDHTHTQIPCISNNKICYSSDSWEVCLLFSDTLKEFCLCLMVLTWLWDVLWPA